MLWLGVDVGGTFTDLVLFDLAAGKLQVLKTPSTPRLRRPVSADNHHAENSDHRDGAAANARLRAAIPATTATETARPMVSRGLGGERQLLRTRLRQGAGGCPQEGLVPGRLARERQLLHPLRVRRLRLAARQTCATILQFPDGERLAKCVA